MAQPSVAREPSMEEILASIRRIIESNDPVNGKLEGMDARESYEAAGDDIDSNSYDDAQTDFGALEFRPANDPGPTAPAPQPPQVVVKEPQKTVSLADLAARVRSASERFERPAAFSAERRHADMGKSVENTLMPQRLAELRAPLVQASVTMAAMDAPAVLPERPVSGPLASSLATPTTNPSSGAYSGMSAPMAAPVRTEEDRIETKGPAAVQDDAVAALTDFVADVVASQEAEVEAETQQHSEPAAMAADVTPSNAASQQLAMLVSENTIEQVSRSFGELAAAIDGQQRRSLDEMAEDMLRPMLREWLDDNLPTLVERLVREEIERVARGPRR